MAMIPTPPEALYVFGHLEFGDALILNGLIRVLARQHRQVRWITKTDYVRAVRATIEDLPNVQVLAALNYEEVRHRWIPQCPNNLRLGYFADSFDEANFDSEMYRIAGMPFEARWSECRFPTRLLSGSKQPKKNIALVHEDYERNFLVRPEMLPNDMEIFRVNKRASILDWLPDVFAAKELHFIDSAFLNLAESLHAVGALSNTTLVFHRYAKRYGDSRARWPQLRAPWRVFD
jgi:hypothetical protein